VHALGAGTDTAGLWLQVPLALTLAAGSTLLGFRVLGTFASGAGAVAAAPPRAAPLVAPPPRPAARLWSTDRYS